MSTDAAQTSFDIAVIGAGATVRGVVKPGEQIEPGDVVG